MSRRIRRNAERAMAIINNPTAYRIMRPGWENVNFITDPTRPGLAIAYNGPTEPSGADLVMIELDRGSHQEGNS